MSGEVNIVGSWNKNIYDCFIRVQNYITSCKNGCQDILQITQMDMNRLPEIQYRTFGFLLTEMEHLIKNTCPKLKKGFYDKCNIQLNYMRKELTLHSETLFKVKIDQRSEEQMPKQLLTPKYWKMLGDIDEISQEIINQMEGLLFGAKEEKLKPQLMNNLG